MYYYYQYYFYYYCHNLCFYSRKFLSSFRESNYVFSMMKKYKKNKYSKITLTSDEVLCSS